MHPSLPLAASARLVPARQLGNGSVAGELAAGGIRSSLWLFIGRKVREARIEQNFRARGALRAA